MVDPILTIRIAVVSLEFFSLVNAKIVGIAIDILGFLGYQIACPDDVVFISGAVYCVRGDANAFVGGNMHLHAEMSGVSFLAAGHFGIPAVRAVFR